MWGLRRWFLLVLMVLVVSSSFAYADGLDDFLSVVLENPSEYSMLIDLTLDDDTRVAALDLQNSLGVKVLFLDPSIVPHFDKTLVVSSPRSPFLADWNFTRPSLLRIDTFRGLKLFVISDRSSIHQAMLSGIQKRVEVLKTPLKEEELVVEQAAPRGPLSVVVMGFVGVAGLSVVAIGITEISRKKRLHDPQLRLRQYFSMLLRKGYSREQLMYSVVPVLIEQGWKEHVIVATLHSADGKKMHQVHA
ncbi:MAG: hypothetical protein O2779_05330 [Nanoarchaeota archaeon]|nr:hypothetical protein [Nanoarchaeota archaeon]